MKPFLRKKIAQDKKVFITKDMNQELKILHHILNNPFWYKWKAPIAFLIPRDPTFTAWGDSSLYSCGGYSYNLKFWWYFSLPSIIREKTLPFFKFNVKDKKTGLLGSLNLLEYATIIINFAAPI